MLQNNEICKKLKSEELKNIPEIILSEYDVLYEMLHDNKFYGMLLQAKDIFELCIKYPQVILLSCITNVLTDFETKEIKTKYENVYRIMEVVLRAPLSLGDWELLCNLFAKIEIDELPICEIDRPVCSACLKNIKAIQPIVNQPKALLKWEREKNHNLNAKSYKVSSWRNDIIGHGACYVDESLAMDSVVPLLETLNEILVKLDYTYFAVHIDGHTYKISVDGEHFTKINPFMDNLDSFSYIFDSFYSKNMYASLLDYHNNKKVIDRELSDRLEGLRKKLSFEEVSDRNIDVDTVREEDIKKLEELVLNENIVENYAFYDVVKEALSEDKHIIWIQAERGMGKSVFARCIDDEDDLDCKHRQYSKKRGILPDNLKDTQTEFKVFCFHCDSFYKFTKDAFKTKLSQFCWKGIATSRELSDKERAFHNEYFAEKINYVKLRRTFREYLECAIEKQKCYEHSLKFIIVIDGIDECYGCADNDFYVGELLGEESGYRDIHFVILSRLEKDFIVIDESIRKLQCSKHVLLRDDVRYQSCLHNYIKKGFKLEGKKLSKDLYTELLRVADNRLLYLAAYYRLFKLNRGNIEQILSEQWEHDLLALYLKSIGQVSKKLRYELLNILLVLSIVKVPISIDELNTLCYGFEQSKSFKFLGYLKDLSGFIKIERNPLRKNLISLSNEYWEELLLSENYAAERKDVLNIIYQKIIYMVESYHLNKKLLLKYSDVNCIVLWLLLNIYCKDTTNVINHKMLSYLKSLLDYSRGISLDMSSFVGRLMENLHYTIKNRADFDNISGLYGEFFNENLTKLYKIGLQNQDPLVIIEDFKYYEDIVMDSCSGSLGEKIRYLLRLQSENMKSRSELDEAYNECLKEWENTQHKTLDRDNIYWFLFSQVQYLRIVDSEEYDFSTKIQNCCKYFDRYLKYIKDWTKRVCLLYLLSSMLYGSAIKNKDFFKHAERYFRKAELIIKKISLIEVKNVIYFGMPKSICFSSKCQYLIDIGDFDAAIESLREGVKLVLLLDKYIEFGYFTSSNMIGWVLKLQYITLMAKKDTYYERLKHEIEEHLVVENFDDLIKACDGGDTKSIVKLSKEIALIIRKENIFIDEQF